VIALTFLAAFASDSRGQSQRGTPQAKAKQPEAPVSQPKGSEDQRGTEQSPLVVKVAPTPKTGAEREDEAKERERVAQADRQKEKSDADLVKYTSELALFTKGLFYATAALVVATLGLGVAAFFQSRDTRASVAEAKRAADIAEASLVKLQRAFIFPRDFLINWHWHFDDENKYWWGIRPIYENGGSSATADLTTNLNYELRDSPLPADFTFPLAESTFNALVGPKSTILGGQIAIEGADLLAIQKGTKHLYFWGILRYNDIFENTGEHITTFCRYITNVVGDPLQRPTEENPVRFFFAMHDIYNSAD
jgi:hypothetical protein